MDLSIDPIDLAPGKGAKDKKEGTTLAGRYDQLKLTVILPSKS